MEFEWDEIKQRANAAKHGVDFADAREVFDDPSAYTVVSSHISSERRYVTVGSMKGALIAVIFTRRGNAIRIISARMARRPERKRYGAETTKTQS
jgi:uncharacterized DUF497 family protein